MFGFNKKEIKSAALLDDRVAEERVKDFRFEEIVAEANPVRWEEKSKKDWRRFPIFNQDGSGSCVAQSGAKLMGILYWLKNKDYVHFSATDIYQRRYNKPSSGMIATDALNIMRKGVTLEELVRSQNMNDRKMDGVKIEPYKRRVGDIFKIGNYVSLPIRDIEKVASTIQTTEKGLMVWFYFKRDEWKSVPTVKHQNLTPRSQGVVRHSVTAVDFTMYKGKKAIIIEDSWGEGAGMGGQRIITEDFFNARNFFVGYAIDFEFGKGDPATPPNDPSRPRYLFQRDLRYTSKITYGDKDVIALQNCLKWTGHFPKNVSSTGWFGSITKRSVMAYQKSVGLIQDGVVGQNTRAKLNATFNR